MNAFTVGLHADDPRMACTTQILPGKMPLEVVFRYPNRKEKMRLSQILG
jgi:hypothetical protein